MSDHVPENDLRAREQALSFDDRSISNTPRARRVGPRARCSTHHNLVNNGLLVGECMKLQQEDKICIPVPFYHCFEW